MSRIPGAFVVTALLVSISATSQSQAAEEKSIPEGAQYACPMQTHTDEDNPAHRGAYFSEDPGDCPWCGMKLRPIDSLAWVQARRAAEGAEIAYTCPQHQQVFSSAEGTCPRCKKALEPFKLLYTCSNPEHASVVRLHAGQCPEDDQPLVPFRSIWLSERLAARNAPARPELAERAAYRCPIHPLVHSEHAGHCTICAAKLKTTASVSASASTEIPPHAQYVCPMQECDYFATEPGECPVCGMQVHPTYTIDWARNLFAAANGAAAGSSIPPDATHVCPMQECHHFASAPGRCPTCGMHLKPIADVAWAQALHHNQSKAMGAYVCPMHLQQTRSEPGRCDVCGMQLVAREDLPQPKTTPEAMRVHMNHLVEHYLALHERFAADRSEGAAQQALGVIASVDELEKLLEEPGIEYSEDIVDAIGQLRDAAVRIRSADLDASRVAFVKLSAALRTLVQRVRPSKDEYKTLYIFHCPMSKGDWIQATQETKNPYYGNAMLRCGKVVNKVES